MIQSDDDLRRILGAVRKIACVGMSTNPVRPSFYVARYLSLKGFDVWPVNPVHAGKSALGKIIAADFDALPDDIDMIDIFRRSEHVLPVVEAALARFPALKVIWMQIGVRNEAAADLARAHGLDVVQDRCPKIEYQRLHGELRMGGFATGVISSRLR